MKENRIGLISVTNHNYGSILQTFALQSFVNKLGYKTEIIKYFEPKTNKILRFKNIDYATSRLKMVHKKLSMFLLSKKERENLKLRAKSFDSFITSKLFFSRPCHNLQQLNDLSYNYSLCLLGSDQVWHPMNLLMDFFTLNFVDENICKVAYAPSFGVSEIPVSYKDKYRQYINRFQFLSCREKSGVSIVKNLTKRDANLVCDPTLLLTKEEWENHISDKLTFDEPYIFCYFIGNNPNQRKLIKQFRRTKGCKIVALLHIDEYIKSDNNFADYTPYNVGPTEFLSLIKNARYVMTDSFHATVFSLIFQKEFFVFNRFENGKGKSTTSRIDSLVEMAGVKSRKIKENAQLNDLLILDNEEINYLSVEKNIYNFRTQSIDYLTKSLENAK